MRKMRFILFFVFLSVGLAACNSENRNNVTDTDKVGVEDEAGDLPAITGEVVEINDGRFLVESTVENESGSYIDAIWFSTDEIDSLEVGQIVSVWTTVIAESYPGQAKEEKIEIIEKE